METNKRKLSWTPERREAQRQRMLGKKHRTTPETRAKISATLTGRRLPPERVAAMRGRTHSAEARAKMSASGKGKPKAPDFGAKVSAALKGRQKSPEHCAKLRGARPQWIRDRMSEGIRNRTDEQKKQHIENFRAALTPESRAKISAAHKGKKRSEASRAKIVAVRAKAKYPFNNSKPERVACGWLKERGIAFRQHARLPFYPLHAYDIVVESAKVLIEVDGCYWHGCPDHYPDCRPEQSERDRLHTSIANKNGWQVIHLWEHEINASDFSKLDRLEVQDGQSRSTRQPELVAV